MRDFYRYKKVHPFENLLYPKYSLTAGRTDISGSHLDAAEQNRIQTILTSYGVQWNEKNDRTDTDTDTDAGTNTVKDTPNIFKGLTVSFDDDDEEGGEPEAESEVKPLVAKGEKIVITELLKRKFFNMISNGKELITREDLSYILNNDEIDKILLDKESLNYDEFKEILDNISEYPYFEYEKFLENETQSFSDELLKKYLSEDFFFSEHVK